MGEQLVSIDRRLLAVRRRLRRQGHLGPYLLRRLRSGVLVVGLVALTVFVVTRLVSDPARLLVGPEGSAQQYAAVRAELGLDAPLIAQFANYIRSLVALDFGTSYWQGVPVSDLILRALPRTLLLVFTSLTIATLVGIPLGMYAALKPGSKRDQVASTTSLLGLSMPEFWLGAMLILVFAVTLGWFPTSGMGGLRHLVLPAVTLAVPSLGRIAVITRTTMISELARQHIVVARGKGLRSTYIVFRHALRNVLVPVSTIASYEVVRALAGSSVIVETVFARPGLGYLAFQAIQRQDLVLVQGVVIIIAFMVVAWNLLTDLAYRAIDPRIEF